MTDKVSVYDIITEKIIKKLDEGTVPWRKPWTAASQPRNVESNRPYTGINVLLLACEGYASPYWATWNQIKKFGGNVKKGEASTVVIFWKLGESKTEKDDNGKPQKFAMLRYFRVWNLEQTENVKVPKRPADAVRESSPIEAAEAIIKGYPNCPKIKNGISATYNPDTDVITVPTREEHHSDAEYYSTWFHEAGHSTGHKSRLAREFGKRFGDHDYGREELTAEMTAAFLCNEAGIELPTIGNQAAYIASWKATIKADTQAVVKAASAAQKAADHILGRHEASAVALAA